MQVIKMRAIKSMQNGETELKKIKLQNCMYSMFQQEGRVKENTPGTSSGCVRLELWVIFFFFFHRYLNLECNKNSISFIQSIYLSQGDLGLDLSSVAECLCDFHKCFPLYILQCPYLQDGGNHSRIWRRQYRVYTQRFEPYLTHTKCSINVK